MSRVAVLERYYGVNTDTGTIVDLGIHPTLFSAESCAAALDQRPGRKGATHVLQDQDTLRVLLKANGPSCYFYYSIRMRCYVMWGEHKSDLAAKMALFTQAGTNVGQGICPPVRAAVLLDQLENVAPFA